MRSRKSCFQRRAASDFPFKRGAPLMIPPLKGAFLDSPLKRGLGGFRGRGQPPAAAKISACAGMTAGRITVSANEDVVCGASGFPLARE